MSDRIDPSQYGFTGGPPDGIAFLPDSGITDTQIQDTADGIYATPEEQAGYPDHANPQDLMSVRPGDFYTQAPVKPEKRVVYRPVSAAGGILVIGVGALGGFSFRETAGSTAVIRLRDGNSTAGDLISTIGLAANESIRDWFALPGVTYKYGLYIEVVTGTIEGALYLVEDVR